MPPWGVWYLGRYSLVHLPTHHGIAWYTLPTHHGIYTTLGIYTPPTHPGYTSIPTVLMVLAATCTLVVRCEEARPWAQPGE